MTGHFVCGRPLCVAVQEGRIELAAILLAGGAKVNLACESAAAPTPLHLAAAGGLTVSSNHVREYAMFFKDATNIAGLHHFSFVA